MPTYDLKNVKTGEVKEHIVSISTKEAMVASGEYVQVHTKVAGIISQHKSTLTKAGKDWENHLSRIKAGSGKGNTINV